MSGAALAIALALGSIEPTPGPGSEAAEPEAESELRSTPFVQLGLGGGGVWGRAHGELSIAGRGPVFELDAGALWQLRPRFRLGLSGSLAQTGYEEQLEAGQTEIVGKLRLGVGGPRVWGYGITGLGLALSTDTYDYSNAFDPGVAMVGGLGVRAGLGERVSLGVEVASTFALLREEQQVVRVAGLVVFAVRLGR